MLSKKEVNRAGEVLKKDLIGQNQLLDAMGVLNTWRATHSFPINTFQATLRHRLSSIDSTALVAQRLMRSSSIISKLKRLDGMKLARMQDIGGVRGVLSRLNQVNDVRALYEEVGRFDHELAAVTDYIHNPKVDGYRSVHFGFRYQNQLEPEHNGLFVERQLRTKLPHSWATAVETMDTFLGQGLKARQGESHWLRFFELVSSAFAPIEKRLEYRDGMDSTLKVPVSPFVTLKFNRVSLINYADSRL